MVVRRLPLVHAVMLRVHQEIQRHGEHLVHLEGVGVELECRRQHGHHRRDMVAGTGDVQRQLAQHLHTIGGHAHLLMCLAQGCCNGIMVIVIDLAARKGDLAAMRAQVRRALREHHAQAGSRRRHLGWLPGLQADQHGGIARRMLLRILFAPQFLLPVRGLGKTLLQRRHRQAIPRHRNLAVHIVRRLLPYGHITRVEDAGLHAAIIVGRNALLGMLCHECHPGCSAAFCEARSACATSVAPRKNRLQHRAASGSSSGCTRLPLVRIGQITLQRP